MSGRALRRLPVLALARYIGIGNLTLPSHAATTSAPKANGRTARVAGGADVDMWLEGMEKVIQEQALELEKLI